MENQLNEGLRALLEAREASMSVVISNPHLDDNPMIYVSEEFTRQTGYLPEEVIGQNCRMLQGPGTSPITIQKIGSALHKREKIETDLLNYRKDGTAFMNRVRIRPLFDENGDLMYFVGAQNPL